MRPITQALLAFSLVAVGWSAGAAGAKPAPLTAAQQRIVDEVLKSQAPYECCTQPIAACLKQAPVCPLATRLAQAVTRMAAAGRSRAEIEKSLEQRKQTMLSTAPLAKVAQVPGFSAGEDTSPVVLTTYACGRSEQCAQILPTLYREVTAGRLKGKVKLVFRPFFPTEKEGDGAACGRALAAAAAQNMFWPYLLHLYQMRDGFQQCLLRKWADIKGLDCGAFDLAFVSPQTAALVEASRQEAVANGVTTAPTAFLNGRRIVGPITLESLVDLVEEESERQAARPPAP